MAEALQQHLARLFEEGRFTDVALFVGDRTFRVHRAVLSQAGFFAALMSDSWSGGGGRSDETPSLLQSDDVPAVLEFVIDCAPPRPQQPLCGGAGEAAADSLACAGVTPLAFGEMLRFLYGLPSHVLVPGDADSHLHVPSLLATASYFDVPALLQSVSDHVFATLGPGNAVSFLSAVHNKEFGDPGRLIEDASFAYLFRNATDVGETRLQLLPLAHQQRLLLAGELYVASEFQRYRIALALKRSGRARIEREAAVAAAAECRNLLERPLLQARPTELSLAQELHGGASDEEGATGPGLHAPHNTRATARSSSPTGASSVRRRHIDTTAAPAMGSSTSVLAGARALYELSSSSDPFSLSGGAGGGSLPATTHVAMRLAVMSPSATHSQQQRPQMEHDSGAEDHSALLSSDSTHDDVAVGAVLRDVAARLQLHADEAEHAPPAAAAAGAAVVARPPPPPQQQHQPQQLLPLALSGATWDTQTLPTSPAKPAGSPPGSEPAAPSRSFTAELAELDATFYEVFGSLRLCHLTDEQLQCVVDDGEIGAGDVAAAQQQQALMHEKLAAASQFNVRRLSELESLASPPAPAAPTVPQHVREARWPPFRFGLEIEGVFGDDMSPGADGEARTKSSERVAYAGSQWCLDVKRYPNPEEGSEYVAVYLRRRAPSAPDGAAAGVVVHGSAAPEDTRERTTMGFSIRLCGAPGAPTSNSVCGRSVMGKAFGVDAEQSWGWESFVSVSNLIERPWASGDRLRFVVSLEML